MAAYPVVRRPGIGKPFGTIRLRGGPVVQALHLGSWDTLLSTYDRLSEWLAVHHVRAVPVMWEEYLVGPSAIGDPSAWRTRIVVPLPATTAVERVTPA